MSEVEINIASFPRGWVPLRDAVLEIISSVGGKRDLGLRLTNRYLYNGQLRSALMTLDGPPKPLEASDWGPGKRTVHAAHNPAEGVYVEPYEDGYHFVWHADLALTSPASEPAASTVKPSLPAKPKHPLPKRAATRRRRRGPRRRRRGPRPGTIDRFAQADRALFPEMTALIEQQHITPTEAARLLASKIKGRGVGDSKIRRLAKRYRKEFGKQTATRRNS